MRIHRYDIKKNLTIAYLVRGLKVFIKYCLINVLDTFKLSILLLLLLLLLLSMVYKSQGSHIVQLELTVHQGD